MSVSLRRLKDQDRERVQGKRPISDVLSPQLSRRKESRINERT